MALTNLEFYAIAPKEATNLITNPSVESATTGYAVTNGVMARDATQQRRGVYSLKCTPSAGVAAYLTYNSAVTNGVQYSFSCDTLDVAGQGMQIFVQDSTAAIIGGASWTGDGHWKRRGVTFTANANTPFTLKLQRNSVASVEPWYTDGWQLETGAQSSYFDGDFRGFVRGQNDFFWLGTPHASASYRSSQTRAGGTEVRLKDYMRILAVLGLGMAPILNNALPNVRGGSFYQNTVLDSRTISLNGVITGLTPGAIMASRKALQNAFNPKLVSPDQPMILRIKGYDASGMEQGEVLDAYVQYSGGLEGSLEQPGLERTPLQFQMFLPYLVKESDTGQTITINQSVANANNILLRDKTGAWQALGTGTNGQVLAIAAGNDGAIYAGGTFALAGGVANTVNIAKWDGTAWSALSTGITTGTNVRALAVGADGALYVGGLFTAAGGVANTVQIAKWDGAAWSALGTGAAGGSSVLALAVGPDGAVYAGGNFTSMGGVANTKFIAKWNGAAWSSVSSGCTGSNISALAFGQDGTLYAGGDFTVLNGVSANYIAKLNGSTWTALGSGMNISSVSAVAVGPDGTVYAGGSFTAAGGAANTLRIARWNGSAWTALGSGASSTVSEIVASPEGLIYAGGNFTSIGGITPPGSIAAWNGSTWVNIDLVEPATPTTNNAIFFDKVGNLYLGYSDTGSATAPLVKSVTVSESYPAYPRFVFTGPGTLYQIRNATNRKALYFNLTLVAGETATLNLDPENLSFTSTFRGSLLNTILPGSNMDWVLQPGANNISVFIAGTTTAATTCSIIWRGLYEFFDGGVF